MLLKILPQSPFGNSKQTFNDKHLKYKKLCNSKTQRQMLNTHTHIPKWKNEKKKKKSDERKIESQLDKHVLNYTDLWTKFRVHGGKIWDTRCWVASTYGFACCRWCNHVRLALLIAWRFSLHILHVYGISQILGIFLWTFDIFPRLHRSFIQGNSTWSPKNCIKMVGIFPDTKAIGFKMSIKPALPSMMLIWKVTRHLWIIGVLPLSAWIAV